MPRDPRDTSFQATERRQRKIGELEDQKDPIRIRVGSGPAGSAGAEGPRGRSTGLLYKFNTNTAESDPESGKLKLNNAALASATRLRISETDGDGLAVGPYLATWDDSTNTVRGYVILRSVGTSSDFAIYSITAALSDKGTWDEFTVSHIASGGTLSNNEEISVEFFRVGNVGAQGEEGEAGAPGKEGAAGAATMNSFKESVRVATTANITISTALNNADVLDGVTLATGDRVLVKNQTTKSENGIWVVGVTPVRSTDADAAGELRGGTIVYVEQGTINSDQLFSITTNGSITPATTAHDWALLAPKVVTGKSEVEFTVESLVTAAKKISHGLGVVPSSIDVALITKGDHGIWSTALIDEYDASTFTVVFRTDTNRKAGTKFEILWKVSR